MDTSNADEVTDDILIRQFQTEHDANAFRALVVRYSVPVRRLIESILSPRFAADCDDVLQEVFVRVYRALPKFRAEAKFSTWLYRIAFNQSVSYKARIARHETKTNEMVSDFPSDVDPAAALKNAQLRETLDAAIDRLPAEYQVAVRMYYWLHVSVDEIASISGVPANTVKSYLHRARKLLAYDLQQQEEHL